MKKKVLLGILVIFLIAFVPLFVLKDAEFGGSDDAGSTVVEEVDSSYQPWATPVLEKLIGGELPGEVESLIFCLQTGIGVGIIAFIKLRYENAGEKFAFSVITLCICVMSRSVEVAAIVLAVTGILTIWKGGVPVLRYLKFLTIPLAFLFLSTAAVMFNVKKTPMDFLAVPVGDWYITASHYSFFYALQLILTALAAVSCLYFLAFSTPMPDILEVLRKLHCPGLLIELMLLIYRFIFVLMETASAISVSQKCRLGNKDYRTSVKSFGLLGSVLMIRAVKRANRLYDAMEARCYDGTIRVLTENRKPKKKIIAAIIVFDTALLIFAVWRRFFL